jgi:hypothetical protein
MLVPLVLVCTPLPLVLLLLLRVVLMVQVLWLQLLPLVPARFIVWLFVLVLVAPDWPYFVLAHAHLGLFVLICLYQIQS